MELSSVNVGKVFLDCLWETPPEDPKQALLVEGITLNVGFDPLQVQKHKDEIDDLVGQLPEDFKDGQSFLRGCLRKDGVQWGEQRSVEELFLLGMATGKMKCLAPKQMWPLLPGGMPYFQVV